MESPREKGSGVGGYSIKLCSERFRPEVQSKGKSIPLPLYILFLTKGTPFEYLPLKSCTLFIYMLRENKSVRKEVFGPFSCNL